MSSPTETQPVEQHEEPVSFEKSETERSLDEDFSRIQTYEDYCKQVHKEPTPDNWTSERYDIKTSCIPPRNSPQGKAPDFDKLGWRVLKTLTGEQRKNKKGDMVDKVVHQRVRLNDEDRVLRKKEWMMYYLRRKSIGARNQEAYDAWEQKVKSGELPANSKFTAIEKMKKDDNEKMIALNSTIGWDDKCNKVSKKKKDDKELQELIDDVALTSKKLKIEAQRMQGFLTTKEGKRILYEMSFTELD